MSLLLPLTLSLLLSQSTNAYRNGSGDCQFPCVAGSMPSRTAEGYAPEFSCCDDIWLPQVVAYNLIPPYHTQFNGLIVGEDGKVGWYKSLYGKYFTNMQFSLFPLDTQSLQISLGLTSISQGAGSQTVRFVPSATASMFLMRNAIEGQKKKVDSVSGWSIQDVSMQVVDQPLEEAVDYFIEYFGTPPVPEEPMPVAGDNDTNRDPSNPFRDPEFRHHGVNIYISIKVRWVHNISAFRSSHPSMVLTLSPLAGISFVFHVSKEEKEKQEAFASSPSSPKAETPSLTKSSQMSSFKAVLKSSARSERWLTFSRCIRKLKGDHEPSLGSWQIWL